MITKDKPNSKYFLKQLPPNPGPGLKLLPILESEPTANETSSTFAPVASHKEATEFIELTL